MTAIITFLLSIHIKMQMEGLYLSVAKARLGHWLEGVSFELSVLAIPLNLTPQESSPH